MICYGDASLAGGIAAEASVTVTMEYNLLFLQITFENIHIYCLSKERFCSVT